VASRVVIERGGARATRAAVGECEVELIRFPPGYRIPPFEFDRGYIAIVLDGVLTKTFGRETRTLTLTRDSVATLPADAVHATAFGPSVTRVITIRGREPALADLVRRLRCVRGTAVSGLGRRLAVELQTQDTSWGLAAEGLVLQLLATTSRDAAAATRAPWLRSARDLLHERAPDARGSLGEIAATVGVHPAHLARCFRREYGQSVGEYARALRLEWAAEQLALNDASLAEIAVHAGFADQSHFTRAFRRHTGVTPGRYRELITT
jgi:AraC family transcriptional regulator